MIEERAANYYDQYIVDEVVLPDRKGEKLIGKFRKRVKYDYSITGKVNYNPMHDKFLYEVEYPDGTTKQLADNIIAGNIMSQVDSEGHHYQVLTEVADHNKDGSAISNVDSFVKSSSVNLHWKRKTRCWKLLVELKDGSVDLVPLKDLKQSNPFYMDEYAVENDIIDEPAFKWWVKETLRHIDRIISKVKSNYFRTSHKFAIRVPKTVKEAYEIEKKSGMNFGPRLL